MVWTSISFVTNGSNGYRLRCPARLGCVHRKTSSTSTSLADLETSEARQYLIRTDFGLADDAPELKPFCITERYITPAVYTGERYTIAVDVWSLGVSVLEYAYSVFPFAPRMPTTDVEDGRFFAWLARIAP